MKRTMGWTAAFVGVLSMAAWAQAPKAEEKAAAQPAGLTIGKPAPDFTLKGADGKEYKLADTKGKVVVLEWTNHQCPFVKRHQAEKKTMQNTFAKFQGKPVVWMAIDSTATCAENAGAIKEFATKNGTTYPILLDADGKVGKMYGAKTTPHMFVIDQKGNLAYMGAIDNDEKGDNANPMNYVEQAVNSLLTGSTVATAETKSYGCSVKYKQ